MPKYRRLGQGCTRALICCCLPALLLSSPRKRGPSTQSASCGRRTLAALCLLGPPACAGTTATKALPLLRRQPRRLDDLLGTHAIIDQELTELLRRVHHRLERALDHVPAAERRIARNAHDLAAQPVDQRARNAS